MFNNLKVRKLHLFFIILTFFLCVLSAFFAYWSLKNYALFHIGVYFPMFFFGSIFIYTVLYSHIKKLLGRFFKFFAALVYIGIAFFTIGFSVFSIFIINYTPKDIPGNIDLVIVLGCQTYGYTPSKPLRTRLDEAKNVLDKYPAALCVTSGGQGPDESVPEGEAMRKYLISKGIAEERVYKEDKSKSTFENLIFTKKLAEDFQIPHENVIIVSNEYHVPRALLIAERMGYNAYLSKAPTPPETFWSSMLREFFAFFKSYLFDKV